MFSKIVLENFKSFDHFEFDLVQNKNEKKAKKLAVIYGENAIGKSTIVDAFKLLNKIKNSIAGNDFAAKFFGKAISGFNSAPIKKLYLNDDFVFSAADYISIYKKIGSKDNMRVFYEGFIKGLKYGYSVVFNDSSIIGEKLSINGEIAFGLDRYGRAMLPNKHFFAEELQTRIIERFKMVAGNHTLLACINSIFNEIDKQYSNEYISESIRLFLNELNHLYVFKEGNTFPTMLRSNSGLLPILVYGNYNDSLNKQLARTKDALTMYFASIYSNVKRIDYDFEVGADGQKYYSLVFVEGKNQIESRVPYNLVSTGTKKLLELFPLFYEIVSENNIVVIDEIDSGINDILLNAIFSNLDDDIKGQLIVTTHNTLLLKNINKKNIYLLDRDSDSNVISYSLDSFGRQIQSGTDVVGQYLKGLYGGVPQSGNFSMKYIVKGIKNGK